MRGRLLLLLRAASAAAFCFLADERHEVGEGVVAVLDGRAAVLATAAGAASLLSRVGTVLVEDGGGW